jgi:tripartite-type tricarboxylate transporter receptor subunit TctC
VILEMPMRMRGSLPIKVAAILLALTTAAAAQDYPTKPVRIIVPFPPGAFNDIVARLVATQLSTRLGRQVIVENRAGAGGIIATETVANAPKDGHTLLLVSSSITVLPAMQPLPYDTIKSFTPIAMLASAPNVVTGHPSLQANSLKELIALAKKQPGKLQYASAGIGTFPHLGAELFKLTAGIDLLHVPFKGSAPALIDVVGGHTQLTFATIPSSLTHIRSGKLKVFGVGGTQRNPLIPEVPTVEEAGLPGYTAANWNGILAPAGTPAPIIARLHREISGIQDTPELQKQFTAEGADVVRMSPPEFAAYIASEIAKWGRVVKEAGIKPE